MNFPWNVVSLCLALTFLIAVQVSKPVPTPEDPYMWLEDVTGEKALEWVKARNAESGKALAEAPGFAELKADLLKILDSKERIPDISKHGPYYYNFWRDEKNTRGVWRRTRLVEFKKSSPAWEIVLVAVGSKLLNPAMNAPVVASGPMLVTSRRRE